LRHADLQDASGDIHVNLDPALHAGMTEPKVCLCPTERIAHPFQRKTKAFSPDQYFPAVSLREHPPKPAELKPPPGAPVKYQISLHP
jgi:hypothetical protein